MNQATNIQNFKIYDNIIFFKNIIKYWPIMGCTFDKWSTEMIYFPKFLGEKG